MSSGVIRDLHANGKQLPELDKRAVNVHPMAVQPVSYDHPGIGLTVIEVGQAMEAD